MITQSQTNLSHQHTIQHSSSCTLILPGTKTPLHRDQGGLSILINVIVGQKEVTMVHSADGHKIGYGVSDPNQPSFATHPQAAFARAWKIVLDPGDLLVMPAGMDSTINTNTDTDSFHSLSSIDTLSL